MFLEISCLSKNKSNKANIKLTFILQKKKHLRILLKNYLYV